MDAPVIRIEGLSKKYRVGAAQSAPGTFYDLLSGILSRRGRGRADPAAEFWALRDLHLEIASGDVLGIVGRNGAGKSTLLKTLARITAPTTGRVAIRGRVASLLEIGTGFHPELTGRENIYLNAAILGMKRAEIDRKLDAIVDFSGVEKFIDTPVKRYSSGMYVRLAFAVAAHVDADVLLVDEVLAVGDAEFQKRCLGTMTDVARRGRTVLFVSHNATALRNLCTSGLLLKEGRVQLHGGIDAVLNAYSSTQGTAGGRIVDVPAPREPLRARITRAAIAGAKELTAATSFAIDVTVHVEDEGVDAAVFLHCHDASGTRVFSHGSFFDPSLDGRRLPAGEHRFRCNVPAHLLNAGEYSFDAFLVLDRHDIVQGEPGVLSVQLHDVPTGVEGWHWPVAGVIRPKLGWDCVSEPALDAARREFA